jgi:hypothetical protein
MTGRFITTGLPENDILPAADSAAALGYAQALQVVG